MYSAGLMRLVMSDPVSLVFRWVKAVWSNCETVCLLWDPEGLGLFIWGVWSGYLLENNINLLSFEQKLDMKRLGLHHLENCFRVNRLVIYAVDSVSKVLICQAHPRIYRRSHGWFGKSEEQTDMSNNLALNRLACLLRPTYFDQIRNASLLCPL
jgi:hypothetical protein